MGQKVRSYVKKLIVKVFTTAPVNDILSANFPKRRECKMRQLNVVIIGQGRSGRDIHGLHLKKDTERFKVVGVVEKMDVRRRRAEAE